MAFLQKITFQAIGMDSLLEKLTSYNNKGFILLRIDEVEEIFEGSEIAAPVYEVKMYKKRRLFK